METLPKVSVILPVYNGAAFLDETIKSARTQLLANIEIIGIDDLSTDGSKAILESHGRLDDRVRVLSSQANSGGPARPKNIGIRAARGEYLSFLDQDDLDHPEKLSWATQILDSHPDHDAVFFDINTVSGHNRTQGPGALQQNDFLREAAAFLKPLGSDLYDCSREWFRQMAGGTIGISTQGLVIRRESFLKIIQSFDEDFRVLDDTNAWFKLASNSRLLFCARSACWYRVRDDSVSNNLLKMRKEALRIHGFWHLRIRSSLAAAERSRHRRFIANICVFLEWKSRQNGERSVDYALQALKWGRSPRDLVVLLKSLASSARPARAAG